MASQADLQRGGQDTQERRVPLPALRAWHDENDGFGSLTGSGVGRADFLRERPCGQKQQTDYQCTEAGAQMLSFFVRLAAIRRYR